MALERLVKRLHLAHQAFGFCRERIGIHVVVGAPQCPEIGKPEHARALIGDLHHPHVVVAHGRAHGAPALPNLEKLIGVAAVGHDVDHVRLLEALAVVATVLVRAVGSGQLVGEPRDLRNQLFVGRRRHRKSSFEHSQLAPGVESQVEPVEAGRCVGQIDCRGGDALLGGGGDLGAVVGDVRGLHPVGVGLRSAQCCQLLLRLGDECVGVGRCDRTIAGCGARQRGEENQETSGSSKHRSDP